MVRRTTSLRSTAKNREFIGYYAAYGIRKQGRLKKFFDIYDAHRWEFDSLEDFVHWYNCVRPHMSLDFENPETPTGVL